MTSNHGCLLMLFSLISPHLDPDGKNINETWAGQHTCPLCGEKTNFHLLRKENIKNDSYCRQYEDSFNYQGIPKALCGKTIDNEKEEYFTPTRIVVIQMK